MGAALIPIGAAMLLLPALATQSFAGQGRLLFGVLSWFALLYATFVGGVLTADCLSAEKREGTIGLLFLTDLKGSDVVLGKLSSSSLNAAYGLLAAVPMLALAVLLGGVTLSQVGLVAVTLLNALGFSLSAGLFVSSLSRDARKALYATVGLVLLVTIGPYAAASIGRTYGAPPVPSGLGGIESFLDARLLAPSPVFLFQLTQSSSGWPVVRPYFLSSLVTTQFLSVCLLAFASVILRRFCTERPRDSSAARWQERWNRWSFGSGARRLAFRASLLDRNAFSWLAGRDRLKTRCVWLLVVAVVGMWLWGYLALPRFMFSWDISAWLLFVIFFLLKIWLLSEVCTRFVEDRQSGALELILCSPLELREIVQGEMRALWRQFGKPVLVLAAFALFLREGALRHAHSDITDRDLLMLFWAGLLVLLADLFTLAWVGLHNSTYRSNLNRALTVTYLQVFLLPWLLFAVSVIFLALWGMLTSRPGWEVSFGLSLRVWLTVSLSVDLALTGYSMWHFFYHFREAATHAYGRSEAVFANRQSSRTLWRELHLKFSGSSRTAPSPSLPKRNRVRFWATVSVVAILSLASAWLGLRHYRAGSRLEARFAQIRQAGQPVTIADLLAKQPEPAKNAPFQWDLTGAAMPPQGPDFSFDKVQWPGRCQPASSNLTEFVREWMACNATNWVAHRRRCLVWTQLPVDWTQPPWTLSDQVDRLGVALVGWDWETLSYLQDGQIDQIVELVHGFMNWARLLGHEPLIWAQRQRLGVVNILSRMLERTLNQYPLNKEQLQLLQEDLDDVEKSTAGDLNRAILGQRCVDVAVFRSSVPRKSNPWQSSPVGWEAVLVGCVEYTRHLSAKDDDELLYYLDATDDCLKMAELFNTEKPGGALPGLVFGPRIHHEFWPWDRANRLLDSWSQIFEQQLEMVARLRVLRTALAVEQFHLETGRYPRSLSEMIPRFLTKGPVDPFDNMPLRYRLLDRGGYVVYSIGVDQKDDHGAELLWRVQGHATGDLTFTVER
jgi:ABC-type transport system involved in multi-copper enzyme maturation permease subunit